jgi:hypothetical protein
MQNSQCKRAFGGEDGTSYSNVYARLLVLVVVKMQIVAIHNLQDHNESISCNSAIESHDR